MNNPYLLSSLRQGPVIVRRIVGRIERKQWDRKTDPERFSFREGVAHLADWEPIFLERMKMAIAESGSAVKGIDEGIRAEEMGYSGTSPLLEAARFVQAREQTIAFLGSLMQPHWSLTITHSEKGAQTIADQASMLVCHDTYHIEHLLQYLDPE